MVVVPLLRMGGLGGICAAHFNKTRIRTLSGIDFSIRGNRCITVVKRSNSNGAALLGVLTSLSGPADKRILLGNEDLSTVKRERVSTFEHSGLKFMFRSFGLLSAFSLGSGVFLPLILSNGPCSRVTGELGPLTRGLKVASVLSGFPCRISNKRGRHTTITETLVAGPRVMLTSRPANTLSSGTSSTLLGLFNSFGRRNRAVLVIARSAGTTSYTGEVVFVGSNRIFGRVCHKDVSGSRVFRGVSSALATVTAENRDGRWFFLFGTYHSGSWGWSWGVYTMCFSICVCGDCIFYNQRGDGRGVNE